MLSTPEPLPAAESSKNPARALPQGGQSSAEVREEGGGPAAPVLAGARGRGLMCPSASASVRV